MRKKVLGFQKVLEELRKGNCIMTIAYAKNDWMIIDNESCTVRNDFFDKAYEMGLKFKSRYQKGSYVQEITLA